MENTAKYTKEMYRNEIVKEGKSISDIALEQGKTRAAIRKEIRGLYIYRAYADQLIGIADANEAAQKLLVSAPIESQDGDESKKPRKYSYAMNLALKTGKAVLDTSCAMDFYDECREIKQIIIPRFCLNEMRNIAEHKTGKERAAIRRKIKYFEKHAEILYVEHLPNLPADVRDRDFKQRNINFARYVKYVWQKNGAKVPYLTRAYEAKVIIKDYVSVENDA